MANETTGGGSRRPLDGVRLLDLTRALSGPYTTMLLAELGAEVVKVEPPDGDETRGWPPFMEEESGYFFALNRSKRSVVINLRDPRGQQFLHRLAARSDVVVENFAPGVTSRLGADYETLSALNPRLIYCSISGFGQSGPYRLRKAYDSVIQALGGVMGLTGQPDGPPAKVGVPIGDICPAMFAVQAVLAGLYWREQSGRGQYVDIGMLDCQVAWLTVQAAIYFATGEVPQRMGTEHPGRVPSAAFLAGDGRYIQTVSNDYQWPQFCALVGLPEMGQDQRYATARQRAERRNEIVPPLQTAMLKRTAAEWEQLLGEAGIPAGIVADLGQVFADPQVNAREMVGSFEYPGLGTVKGLRLPIRYNDLDTGIRSRPPMRGEHTEEILSETGYSPEEIQGLLAAGVVQQERP